MRATPAPVRFGNPTDPRLYTDILDVIMMYVNEFYQARMTADPPDLIPIPDIYTHKEERHGSGSCTTGVLYTGDQ